MGVENGRRASSCHIGLAKAWLVDMFVRSTVTNLSSDMNQLGFESI